MTYVYKFTSFFFEVTPTSCDEAYDEAYVYVHAKAKSNMLTLRPSNTVVVVLYLDGQLR